MKVLILSTYFRPITFSDPEILSWATYKLYLHLKEKYSVNYYRYSDINFELSSGVTSCYILGENMETYDYLIPRGVSLTDYGLNDGDICENISRIFLKKGKNVLNGEHFKWFSHDFNKLFQMNFLAQNNFPIPFTYYGRFPENKNIFPLIAKPLTGSLGKGVIKVEDKTQVPDSKRSILFQQLLPDRTDYRLLILDGQCLGIMKRTAIEDKITSNFSTGGLVEKAMLSQDTVDLAVKAAELFKLDFCGVDIMKDEQGKDYILEVNRFPSFVGFNKALNIRVEESLGKFIEKQINKY